MTDSPPLLVARAGSVMRLTLARPTVRNAFNAQLIAALTTEALRIAQDASIRIVVLSGEGSHFCAGADLQWMKASAHLSEAENIADAQRMGRMFMALDALPQLVIGRIHGAALGGGAGLVAVCDTAIATTDCVFGFTEVRLGLIPANIGPYVLRKIGLSAARAYFTNAQTFSSATALQMNLLHKVVSSEQLDAAVDAEVASAAACAPGAVAATKQFLRELPAFLDSSSLPNQEVMLEYTARTIADRRTSEEGQAGLAAFFERSAPPWKAL